MKKLNFQIKSKLKDQSGVSAIIVGVSLTMLIGFAAMAIDIGYLYVVKNEIQNAADAGALAGANDLLDDAGAVNLGANQTAYLAVRKNYSGGNPVDVDWDINASDDNEHDIQRGHWTFGRNGNPGSFQANSDSQIDDLFDPDVDYNTDIRFINAVRVKTTRTEIPPIFGRILGWIKYKRSADAVAYRGGGGYFGPGEFDLPIAICEEALFGFDPYLDPENPPEEPPVVECGMGRMLNSGSNAETHNTGGWTNFSQPCVTANSTNIPSTCGGGVNVDWLTVGQNMGTVGGVQTPVFEAIRNCFFNTANNSRVEDDDVGPVLYPRLDISGNPIRPLNVTLPVIRCSANNISNCSKLLGAVNVNIIWVAESGVGNLSSPQTVMYADPFSNDIDGAHWDPTTVPDLPPEYKAKDIDDWIFSWSGDPSFAGYFNLRNLGENGYDQLAPLQQKAVYFLPGCTQQVPGAGTGASGNFYGIFSKTSVLVE